MRNRFFVALLLCALVLAAGCTRDVNFVELFDGTPTPSSLTALIETTAGSRTVVENGTQVFWEPGDEIAVFWGGYSSKFVSELSEPEASAIFYGLLTGWKDGTEIWAVYPYAEDAAFNGEGITTTLPARQTARAGSFAQGMNLSIAHSESRTLQFYNVGGGVRFSLSEDGIQKVVLENLGDEPLAGKVRIAMDDALPVVREVTEGSRFVTLLPPDGAPFQKDTWYYIATVPVKLEKGFRLQFYKESTYATRTLDQAVTVKRGIFGSLEKADAGLTYQPLPDLENWSTEKTLRGVQYEEETGSGEEGGEVVRMPQHALFVMDDLNALLESYDEESGQLVYRRGDALTEAGIRVGDVLYSLPVPEKAPDGYIVRVIAVEPGTDKIVLETTPAGLADAFEQLSTDMPIDTEHLSADNITVYDILEQPDQSAWIADFDANAGSTLPISTRSIFDVGMDLSAVTDTNKLKIKVDSEKASLSYVLVDGDDNPKTTYDQIRLVIKLEYEFSAKSFHFDFDAPRMLLSMDFAPVLGITGGFEWGMKGTSDQAFGSLDIEDASPVLWSADLTEKISTMQNKLMGKKIRILSYDLTKHGLVPKAVKAVVRPTIEVYAYFNLSLEGNLEVSFGIEKTPWYLHAENIPYSSMPNLLKMVPRPDHVTPTVKFSASMDFKGSTGLGLGLVARLPRVAEAISYKDPKTNQNDVPWMGFFCEWGLNAKGKAKSWVDLVSGKLHTELSVDVYNELSGYLEAFAHLQTGLLFNPKVDIIKTRWPDSSVYQYKYEWETEQHFPVPTLIAPTNREAVDGNSALLQWKIPKPDKALHSANSPFWDLEYRVYAGTDKAAVNQLARSALIGTLQDANDTTRFDLKSMALPVEHMKTYWWRVLCLNGDGQEFASPLSSFDCGYDGVLTFNDDLTRWLSDHFDALGDVYIQENGTILRTRSNIDALAALNTLEIMDGGIYYHIHSIDDLLKNLPSLQTLDCRGNKITSLDLSRNPQLNSLVCNGNSIESLNLGQNAKLTNLSCKENLLTRLDLGGLSRLKSLNCTDNPGLVALDIRDNPALTALNCAGCTLRSLDLSENPLLVDLYASGNHLDSLDITTCPNLIRLDVYSQSTELLKLRLLRAQMNGFALFKRHFNMAFEYAENLVTWDAVNVAQKSATIPATLRVEGELLQYGILYFDDERELTLSNSHVEYAHARNGGYYTVTLEGLRPGTVYFARAFAVVSGGGVEYGNTVRFKTLSGIQRPEMIVSPDYIDFGELSVGESLTKKFIVINDGDAPLVFHLEGDTGIPFSWSPAGEVTVDPLKSEEVFVTFAPSRGGAWDVSLRILSNATLEPFRLSVSGSAEEGFHVRAVDLGLPSGVKWANCDLGAKRVEDVGTLYAWGELETKETFNQSNYKWYDDGFTKYCFSPEKGRDGFTDDKGVLDPEDDVVRREWGGTWRMPTESEWSELIKGCDWCCDTIQGIPCAKGTSKVTGASILFPMDPPDPREGIYNWRSTLWSSSLCLPSGGGGDNPSTNCARNPLIFLSSKDKLGTIYMYSSIRWYGKYIRPVMGVVSEVRLNHQTLSLHEGGSAVLSATVFPQSAPNRNISWRSSDPSIAYITPRGTVCALKPGTVTITVSSEEGNVQAHCEVTVTSGGSRETVDMGLSVKWASCDVGSTTGMARGDLYRWAEIIPYEEGTPYKWEWKDEKYIRYGAFDGWMELMLSDDAAYQNWGTGWRTPAWAEWQELLDNCDQHFITVGDKWDEENSLMFIEFVSRINGNVLLFPASYYFESYYWSASLNDWLYPRSVHSRGGTVLSLMASPANWYVRGDRMQIRAVYDEPFSFPVKGVEMERDALKLNVGASARLKARILPNNATDQRLTWRSDDPSVATVSDEGLLHIVGEGTAVITVTTVEGGFSATCTVSAGPAPEAVDLGLSVRWSSLDVCSFSSAESGPNFRWGETLPTDPNKAEWIYEYFLENHYVAPGKQFLEPEDDPARALLGEGWRIPTKEEWQELRNNCTWTSQGSGQPYEVKSRINGNVIYIRYGWYYTNEITLPDATCFIFNGTSSSSSSRLRSVYCRLADGPVRAVHD